MILPNDRARPQYIESPMVYHSIRHLDANYSILNNINAITLFPNVKEQLVVLQNVVPTSIIQSPQQIDVNVLKILDILRADICKRLPINIERAFDHFADHVFFQRGIIREKFGDFLCVHDADRAVSLTHDRMDGVTIKYNWCLPHHLAFFKLADADHVARTVFYMDFADAGADYNYFPKTVIMDLDEQLVWMREFDHDVIY